MGNVPNQVANQCCHDKSPSYDVQAGTWANPFQTGAEYGVVSDLFSKASAAPPRAEAAVVVLVGGTGVGKSNLGNYLLGRSAFESRNSQESVTSVTSWIDGTWFGGQHPLRVVDCTGIGDTKGARADQKQWDTTIEVLKTIGKVSALVMVMRAGRFTKFDKEVISTLRESFGPPFWKNMCVFCTGATAKPAQLNLETEGPKIRRKLTQIEQEQGGEETAMQAIARMHVYAADLDPMLCSREKRYSEFKFKPALAGMSLEELLSLDLRIPHNVMAMNSEEFKRFAAADSAIERWIEGNYFALGLSRLAAFKSDVMAMEPTSIATLARLADAPDDEVPPPEHMDPQAVNHLRYFTTIEPLEHVIVSGDVVLLRGAWLEKQHASKKPLPRRQELPSDASWDPAKLTTELRMASASSGGGEKTKRSQPIIVAISYCWLSKKHPDPNCFHLNILVPLLKAFAKWHNVRTDHLAVFLDWSCLPQHPRSEKDALIFERAMQHIHLWYAHTMTNVWMLTHVPPGAESYGGRGWPHFEKVISTMVNPAESVLDMGMLRPGWTTWGQVLQACRVRPMPPPAPDSFATELVRKNFTVDADRELLARRYGEAFRGAVGSAEKLHYSGLRWTDREATRIAKLLSSCESCRELDLQQNDIGRKGGMVLASNIAECKGLERLSLLGNCLDETAVEALRQAWKQAGKAESRLELGVQRAPVNSLEVITSPTMGGASPLSPSGRIPLSPSGRSPTRRSADELAALQMAELGARQAAFEARLHVAINRISSTLSEVGDAVGSSVASPTSPGAGLFSRSASPTTGGAAATPASGQAGRFGLF